MVLSSSTTSYIAGIGTGGAIVWIHQHRKATKSKDVVSDEKNAPVKATALSRADAVSKDVYDFNSSNNTAT